MTQITAQQVADLRANYLAWFDRTLSADTDVDKLSLNDMAQLLAVSYGSIKSKAQKGADNATILRRTEVRAQPRMSLEQMLSVLTREQIEQILAGK